MLVSRRMSRFLVKKNRYVVYLTYSLYNLNTTMQKYTTKKAEFKMSALVLDNDLTTSFTLELPENSLLGNEKAQWRMLAREQIAKAQGVPEDSVTVHWYTRIKDEESFLRDKVRVSKYALIATIDGLKAADQQKIESLEKTVSDLNMEILTAFEDKKFANSKKKGADLLRNVQSVLSVASDKANDLNIIGGHLCQWLVNVIDDLHLPQPLAQKVKEMAQTLANRYGTPEDIQKQQTAAASSSPNDVTDLKSLVDKVEALTNEVFGMKADISGLKDENKKLKADISELKDENKKLKEKNNELTNRVAKLEEKNNKLTNEVAELRNDIKNSDKHFNEKSKAQTLLNFWQYYLRAILVSASIVKTKAEVKYASAGKLLSLLKEAQDKYETWAKSQEDLKSSKDSEPKLLSFDQLVSHATAAIEKGKKMIQTDMFNVLVSDEAMHNIYVPMWDYLAEVKHWDTWAQFVAEHK